MAFQPSSNSLKFAASSRRLQLPASTAAADASSGGASYPPDPSIGLTRQWTNAERLHRWPTLDYSVPRDLAPELDSIYGPVSTTGVETLRLWIRLNYETQSVASWQTSSTCSTPAPSSAAQCTSLRHGKTDKRARCAGVGESQVGSVQRVLRCSLRSLQSPIRRASVPLTMLPLPI